MVPRVCPSKPGVCAFVNDARFGLPGLQRAPSPSLQQDERPLHCLLTRPSPSEGEGSPLEKKPPGAPFAGDFAAAEPEVEDCVLQSLENISSV